MSRDREERQTHEPRFAHVADRLAALREADARLAHALDGAMDAVSDVPDGAIDKDAADALRVAVTALGEPPAGELTALAGETRKLRDPAEQAPAAVPRLQAVYAHVASAHAASVALFQTGRLMLVSAACDLALGRIKAYRSVTNALNALLPQVVAWQLREEGLACHCVCPMCGLGVCGCIWASLHNIDLAVGGAGVAPDDRGVPLRSPPRPGSELAAAGVRQWDHVESVDGDPVRTIPELQTALRRHRIGEDVRLGVTHDGERRELVVKHASDFP
jgi:PDZ domain-containing protein